MSKKKKIILTIMSILIIIIISFIVPVKKEMKYKYGDNKLDVSNPMSGDYTIYTYKNIYGIIIKTSYELGITVIN